MTQRQTKGSAREELLIRAAARAIAELGLANVRVTDVAERAQMSAGHVTYYFPSKAELLMLAIRQSEEALLADVAAEVATVADPWERVRRLIELSASAGPGDPGWVLWFEVWSNAATDDAVARVHDELDAQWRKTLADAVRYGCQRGHFKVEDPDSAALLLSATIDGLSIQCTLGSAGVDRARLLELCLRAAEAILRPRPEHS